MQSLRSLYSKFRKRKWYSQLAIFLAISFLVAVLSILLLFFSVKYEWITDLPSTEEIKSINNPLSTNLYASNGKLFGKFFDENRGNLTPDDLTEDFKNALLATEDVRFYEHNGLDYRALARVFTKSIILRKRESGGGSTLTQQLAKNLYPRQRFWALSLPLNKFREMAIAQKLEKIYTKGELLLLYANTISFGERAFGLYTASNRFFGKEPVDLSLEESAALVGILKAPSYYSPKKYPERCKARRNTVLNQMYRYDFITDSLLQESSEKDLVLNYQALSKSTGLARYFQQIIKKEFDIWAKAHPKENGDIFNINRDGLKIYTTLDYNMQIAAEQLMQSHMKELQKIFDNSWKNGSKYGYKEKHYLTELSRNDYFKRLESEQKSEEEITALIREKREGELWDWEENIVGKFSTEDSIKHYISLLHTGILAVEPKSGKIKTYVGGIDYGTFQYDNIQGKRQVGSTFKPIVYLTGLKKGVTPCDYFANELRIYSDYKDWQPENSDGKYGGFLSVQEALTRSVNTVSVQLIFKAGIDNVLRQAESLGITSNLPAVPSLVLGTADISLQEMVTAYAGIANGGKIPELYGISKIEDSQGNLLYENARAPIKIDSIPLAYAHLHDVMANVTNEGTGARMNNYDIPFDVMGKTGTTQNQTDGWFIGFTSDLVIGSWVGAQNRGIHFRNLGTGSGGRTALPMVGGLFEFVASQGYKPTPLGTGEIYACPDSISREEYALLMEYPNDYDRILASRNRDSDDIFDSIFGNGNRNEDTYGNGSGRKPRTSKRKRKQKRESDFDKFRKKIEEDLKDIFKSKKRKNKKRRNN